MATNDEIYDAISDDLESGVKRRRSNDREIEYMSPEERIKAAQLLSASQGSPFVKVGFKSREF